MTLEEIKKLANLARIDMDEEEMLEIAKSFEPILAYVGQVKEVTARQDLVENKQEEFLQNVMREDTATNKTGESTEKILKNMPETQDGYLKVKQIL